MAGTKVGPAENIPAAVPVIDTPEHVKAAETATRELNAPFLTVMLEGRYTDGYLSDAGADASPMAAPSRRSALAACPSSPMRS